MSYFQGPPSLLPRQSLSARGWAVLMALITALIFLAVVSSAITHIHGTNQETHHCSICSLHQDQVDGDPLLPTLPATQFFKLLTLAIPALHSASYLTPLTLPHSCGPPQNHEPS